MSSRVKQVLTGKTAHVAVRVPEAMHSDLREAAHGSGYGLTVSQIVVRGIELALAELRTARAVEQRQVEKVRKQGRDRYK